MQVFLLLVGKSAFTTKQQAKTLYVSDFQTLSLLKLMRFSFLYALLLVLFALLGFSLRSPQRLPEGMRRLVLAYPEHFSMEKQNPALNVLIWNDGTVMPYDDGLEKDFQTLLDKPDLEDQMKIPYRKGKITTPDKNEDAGRIRYEPFFRKMYGNTAAEVQKNLTTIIWLPKNVGAKLQVTKINGVDKKLQAISDELDQKPHLKKYLQSPGGTFNWRTISGTNRLSAHSFGMTIDINVAYSHYWQWSAKTKDENAALNYQNQIPQEIIDVFEKHGFIWGGRWYHFDTMHFEYRPDLLIEL
jgi:peptidoglycan LD-endopeptidase CwlK